MNGKISHTVKLARAIDAAYAKYDPGDPNCEESLYMAFKALAKYMVRQHPDLDDNQLISTIVHRAMEGLKQFRQKSALSSWFFTLARNEVRRAQRVKIEHRNRHVSLGDFDQNGEEHARAVAYAPDPDAKIDFDRLCRVLPAAQAEVITLMREGYSLEKIAELMGEPIGTIRGRHRLAKQKLSRLNNIVARQRK